MKNKLFVLMTSVLMSSCMQTSVNKDDYQNVYVADFGSDDIKLCGPSDVDLSHREAKDFFLRAQQVEHRVIHDHYAYAPCYIEGTMTYQSKACEWEIRAGATAHISCGEETKYFVCDSCEDLFRTK